MSVSAAEPAVASLSDSENLIVYAEHSAAGSADIYVQRFANGSLAGERTRVNPVPGEAKSWQGDPPTVTVAPGAVYVGWNRKYSSPQAKGNDLMISVSRDGGTSFEQPVRVNDDDQPASHGMHSAAVDDQDRLFVAWLDERSLASNKGREPAKSSHHENAEPNSEVFYAVSTDGAKTFSANKRMAAEVCPCCKTSLFAKNGLVYAAWRQVLEGDHRHIAVARSEDAGTTFGNATIVSNDQWQISACPVSGAALASPEKGVLEVIWYTAGAAGQAGLYYARSADAGRTFGDRVLLSNTASTGTPVLFSSANGRVIFPGISETVNLLRWERSPSASALADRIEGASSPAAAEQNGRIVAAFVRNEGKAQSVWVREF